MARKTAGTRQQVHLAWLQLVRVVGDMALIEAAGLLNRPFDSAMGGTRDGSITGRLLENPERKRELEVLVSVGVLTRESNPASGKPEFQGGERFDSGSISGEFQNAGDTARGGHTSCGPSRLVILMKKRRIWLKFLFVMLPALGGLIAFQVATFPDVARLAKENPKTTAWMEMRDAEARAKGGRARRYQVWVPLNSISPALKNAVLIAEDAAFFQHEGLDYSEIKEAIKINAEKLEFARGASTITQQLAKNLYLSPSKNPLRKLKELILTFALEHHLSKRRIFEIYLNEIEWGDGIYGAEAAARTYFGRSCSSLTDEEAAALAAVIINPRRYSPVEPNKRIRFRIAMILERMQKYRYYRN